MVRITRLEAISSKVNLVSLESVKVKRKYKKRSRTIVSSTDTNPSVNGIPQINEGKNYALAVPRLIEN